MMKSRLARQKDRLLQELRLDYQALDAISSRIEQAEAALLQIVMHELTEEYPEVTGFRFEASYEYVGDEAYGYSVDYFLEGAEDEELWTFLRECSINPQAIQTAFESDDWRHGEMSAERIRAIFAGESHGV